MAAFLSARAPAGCRTLRSPATRHAPQRRAAARASQSNDAGDSRLATFTPPTPQRFRVDPAKLQDLATSAAGFLFRGTSGALAAGYAVSSVDDDPAVYAVLRAGGKMSRESSVVSSYARPKLPLELYEFQGCPFCKRVRECLIILDLDAVFYPCPRDGPTWRPKAIAEGKQSQFPYLVDPNTGVAMYESAAIVEYLAKTYGDGTVPAGLASPVAPLLLGLALLPRLGRGSKYRKSKVSATTQPLTLWSYEASPFCIIVREALNELEIPHLLKAAARGSPKRDELFAKTGLFQVPFLQDPNTGKEMFESSFILKYLEDTYAVKE